MTPTSRILARELPDARLIEMPEGGHLFLGESAAEVAPGVLEFLS
jgi:pimeloyl-ACP methyl ester carboxylesterase